MILKKALERLRLFYTKGAALVEIKAHRQEPGAEAAPAPAGFGGDYQKNEKSGGVMNMLEGVIRDSSRLEKEAIAAEQDAQVAYETFISDSNKSIAMKSRTIANKSEEMAKADTDLEEKNQDLKSVMKELEILDSTGKQLHYDCDFLLKNFGVRQDARAQEIEALQ